MNERTRRHEREERDALLWHRKRTSSARRTHMSEQIRDPAAAAKKRQRGLTVLERQAEEQRIESEKEAARRPRAAAKRSQSVPCKTKPPGGLDHY